MFRTLARLFLPNPFDWMLKRTARKGGKKILLCWNRGLGDIALGLYAMVHRIRQYIPDAEITFVTRENLRDGFSMLEGVKTIVIPGLKRGEPVQEWTGYDLVIKKPSPTDWVPWQRSQLTPKLKWDKKHDRLHEKFDRLKGTLIGVQVVAETNYGLWRNWPLERWQELFDQLEKINVQVVLFGFGKEPSFTNKNIVDLRGQTTLFELLSIIKHRLYALILPDSGISSMTYYLDDSFPLRLITLWADPHHGILKQNVPSPNPQLVHCPLVGTKRDLSTVSVGAVIQQLFPVACILLAGGQGTRLGFEGPKGLFSIGGKTLFQHICDKIPPGMPLAIMTSPINYKETVAYFKENDNFGLDVHFFEQEMVPFLDAEKRPMEIKGPNGNGSVFYSFVKAGLGELFAKKGVQTLSVVYIENPLAQPFDPGLFASKQSADVVVQCIERRPTDHPMGMLVEKNGKIEIVEYTELDPSQEYKHAYSGAMLFDLAFFCKMAEKELPLHWVRKKIPIGPNSVEAWKGEQFIFDCLPYAEQPCLYSVQRETHYAPLKSKEDIAQVEEILRNQS